MDEFHCFKFPLLLFDLLVVFLNKISWSYHVLFSVTLLIKSATLQTVKEMEDDYQANVLSKKGLRWDFIIIHARYDHHPI